MKNLFVLLLLCFFSGSVLAQYDPTKVGKKASQLYVRAMQLANDEHFKESIEMLKQAISIEPAYEDAYLSIAGMYGEMKNYPLSIENYEKAKAIDSTYFVDYSLPYSINLAGMGQFDKALDAVNAFLNIHNLNEASRKAGEYRKKCYQFALDYAATHPGYRDYKFEPRNLGDSINTAVSEYYPTISLDGNTLIFTRRVNNMNEDFYESKRSGDNWSKANSLPGNINTNQNEAAQSVSLDGQILIFNGCNFPEGMGSCDLYISYLTPQGWSSPENLGDSVNTEFWESAPSLSPDKRDLYFASNRPGGYGGSDIYVSHRLPNGRWSAAQNLGPQVNTAGDEGTPFIHFDNQSLYFNSSGHPGYGSNDLFVSRKKPDGTWNTPENLGYPINTIEDEGSLVVAADGTTAYYASDRADSRGGLDIYTFQLRSDIRPARTLWVKGKVFDEKTKKGLPSSVELTDLSTRALLTKVQTDETGNYLITLPVGKDYAFEVSRRGYLFYSENFPLSQKQADSTYNIDIPLEPIEAGATIVLKNIFFDVNRYDLKPESQVELDKLVQFMRENPSLVVQISGHTDNTGKPADNMSLSENRARAVVSYLTAKGIEAKRLQSKGWGDTKPIADNRTEQGRARNRRTEMRLVSIQ
jgi:outer membrane protein OmpA-like peptidoglycan-associated protein/tetratricopeptide (TPR) repeat protein